MDMMGSFFKTRRMRCGATPRGLTARPTPCPNDVCLWLQWMCDQLVRRLCAVLLNPVPQFVRVNAARSIKFDRRERAFSPCLKFVHSGQKKGPGRGLPDPFSLCLLH